MQLRCASMCNKDVIVMRMWISRSLDCTCKWFILLSPFDTLAWLTRRSLDFTLMIAEDEGCVYHVDFDLWIRIRKYFLNYQSSWSMSLSIGNSSLSLRLLLIQTNVARKSTADIAYLQYLLTQTSVARKSTACIAYLRYLLTQISGVGK